MTHAHITIFTDTNSLLHYPQLKDVDWCNVADADEVKIVICMEVIHELDSKKSDSRLSSRAERVIKEIKSICAQEGRVREHVTLEIFNQLVATRDDKIIVSGDEKIIYEVKAYARESGDANVAVYTEDMGMSLRCKAHGTTYIEPNRATRLENPQSEMEKKYKQAIIELNSLKNLQPRLDVELSDKSGSSPLSINVKKVVPSSVEEEVLSVGVDLGLPDSDDARRMRDEFDVGPLSPTKEDRHLYEKECEKYLEAYRKWLEKKNELEASQGMEFAFKIVVTNSGTTFGEDVNVCLMFPPIMQFIDGGGRYIKGRRIRLPEEPMRPPKPVPAGMEVFSSAEEIMARINAPMVKMRMDPSLLARTIAEPPGAPSWSLGGTTSDGFRVRISLPKLNHHTSKEFGPFTCAFQKWADAKPFQIGLEVIAANMVAKVDRRIDVMVNAHE